MDNITPKTSVRLLSMGKCHLVKLCNNTRCFFKQRSLGLCMWYSMDEEVVRKNKEIYEQYGQWETPEIVGSCGTNEVVIRCQDFINDDWDGSSYHRGIKGWEPICVPLPKL